MIKELCDYIVSTLGGVTKGTTLQVGFRRDTAPDECTVIRTLTGGARNANIAKQVERPVQILTRGKAYHAAEAECTRIFEFLLSIRQVTLTGFHIYTATGIEPQYLGLDAKGRHEFSANVVLRLRKD